MKKLISFSLLVSSVYASQFSVNPSFQGFTGVINTPNAQVTKEGHATLHLNNQFDNSLRSYNYDKKDSSQEDYILGFGLFSFMEVQARLSEAPGYHRDLSVNTKLQLPYHHKYLPDIAIGIQDLGGAANSYDNKYIVLDKELWFVRASLGYGVASVERGAARMDGVFGSLEVQTTDWLYLLAEDDTMEQHVGLRVEMPKDWIQAFNLRGTVVQNVTNSETSFGLTVDIPLWHQSKIDKEIYQEKYKNTSRHNSREEKAQEKTVLSKNNSTQEVNVQAKPQSSLTSIEKTLVDFGFENVSVAVKDDTMYVRAENSIFDHTDLDALGYIAGTVSMSNLEHKNYTITLLKDNLQTITMSGDCKTFQNYINEPSFSNEKALADTLKFSRDFDDSTIAYSEKKNSSRFIPRVELSLGLINAVGTEVGVFDYVASLKANTYMNLYDGLIISAMYETPLFTSNDFEEGGAYYAPYKSHLKSRFSSIMAHQTLHFDNLINTLSVGKYATNYLGAMNQANYTTTSGEHAFKYNGGYFTHEDDSSKEVYFSLGSYRYMYAPLDSSIEVTYGKYWYGDVGTTVEFRRFFGETSVAFNVKSTTADGIDEHFAGINLSFPLTTRKLFKANYFQVKGKNDFSYKLRTTVKRDDGTNTLNHAYGRVPESDFEVTSRYLNRDRLSGSYIKQHLDRLREAYVLYK